MKERFNIPENEQAIKFLEEIKTFKYGQIFADVFTEFTDSSTYRYSEGTGLTLTDEGTDGTKEPFEKQLFGKTKNDGSEVSLSLNRQGESWGFEFELSIGTIICGESMNDENKLMETFLFDSEKGMLDVDDSITVGSEMLYVFMQKLTNSIKDSSPS